MPASARRRRRRAPGRSRARSSRRRRGSWPWAGPCCRGRGRRSLGVVLGVHRVASAGSRWMSSPRGAKNRSTSASRHLVEVGRVPPRRAVLVDDGGPDALDEVGGVEERRRDAVLHLEASPPGCRQCAGAAQRPQRHLQRRRRLRGDLGRRRRRRRRPPPASRGRSRSRSRRRSSGRSTPGPRRAARPAAVRRRRRRRRPRRAGRARQQLGEPADGT